MKKIINRKIIKTETQYTWPSTFLAWYRHSNKK